MAFKVNERKSIYVNDKQNGQNSQIHQKVNKDSKSYLNFGYLVIHKRIHVEIINLVT